jgi:hypothetical protein
MQDKKILPKVYIDNFILDLPNDIIMAYCLIDEKDIDFSIIQTDFEIWVDKHNLREFYQFEPIYSWNEVYQDRPLMYKFIKLYIEDLYIQKAFDLQTPLKNF